MKMASSACLPTAGVPGVGNANGMGYCGKEGNEEQVLSAGLQLAALAAALLL